jgi:hypothetical protein
MLRQAIVVVGTITEATIAIFLGLFIYAVLTTW